MSADFSQRDLKAYLLGRLSDEKRCRIEQKYLADQSFFESLRGLEQQLIDSYVTRRLSFLDRRSFRRCYLTTEDGMAQVALARGLAAALSPEVASHGGLPFVPTWRTVAVVAAAGILACVALSLKVLNLNQAMKALRAENDALRERAPLTRATGLTLAFALYPNSHRLASSLPGIEVPSDAQVITLKAHVENDTSRSYTATITRLGDRQIAALEAKRNGPFAEVVVPAGMLQRGEYRMSLASPESAFSESYLFLISRK